MIESSKAQRTLTLLELLNLQYILSKLKSQVAMTNS
jgi:hypothetical protein